MKYTKSNPRPFESKEYITGAIGRSGKAVHLFSIWDGSVRRYPVCGSARGGFSGLLTRGRYVSPAVNCKKCLQYIEKNGLKQEAE